MTPAAVVAHLTLLLREDDPAKVQRLMAETLYAANKAGVDLKAVFEVMTQRLHESDSPLDAHRLQLADRLQRLSIAVDSGRLTDV